MNPTSIALAPRWRDLVFHVLAHVPVTAHLAASLFDARYVSFAERWLGPPASRALGNDIAVLGRTFTTHDALARAQVLAWLFDSPDQAGSVRHLELAELTAAQVASSTALAALDVRNPGLEVLRAAAELEAEHHGQLPAADFNAGTLEGALAALRPVAPWLARVAVSVSRALRLRGRAFRSEILVGCPGQELGVTVEHVAWQAAHEATVLEVSAHAGLDERTRESAALVLLAERAERAAMTEDHGAWLSHFGKRPSIARAALTADALRILEVCIRSP